MVEAVDRFVKKLSNGNFIYSLIKIFNGSSGPYAFESNKPTQYILNHGDFFCLLLKNMWFQQEGTTCYTILAHMALFKETFPGSVISHRGDIN